MRPNVEFRVELPNTNTSLAKSHFQWKTRGYAQKITPDTLIYALVGVMYISPLTVNGVNNQGHW